MAIFPFAQIDAFASQAFEGNQACVMPMDNFLSDDVLQKIAAENNVAETAFIVPDGSGAWQLRWFTPAVEVPLCGHATFGAGHYLYSLGGYDGEMITFRTRKSGELFVSRLADGRLEMDFPSQATQASLNQIDDEINAALGKTPKRVFTGPFYVALYDTAAEIEALDPDLERLTNARHHGRRMGYWQFRLLGAGWRRRGCDQPLLCPWQRHPRRPRHGQLALCRITIGGEADRQNRSGLLPSLSWPRRAHSNPSRWRSREVARSERHRD